jgi:hypothetical protein
VSDAKRLKALEEENRRPSVAGERRAVHHITWKAKFGGMDVALLIPCRRQSSAVFAPASCSRRMAMICSSVNFDLFIVRSSSWAGLQYQMEELSGVRAHAGNN